MATSGTYSFGVNRNKIIRQALLNIGKIDRYDVPDAVTIQDSSLVLNMICKQMMGNADFAPGMKVWTRKRGHLFLSNSTGQYTVGPNATGWTNSYVYPTLTVPAAAGATTVTLSSVTSLATGAKVGICLDDGSLQWVTATNVNTGTKVVTFAAPGLDSAASVGAQVFGYQTGAQNVLVVESAVLREATLDDTPLQILKTTQDYDILPTKANPEMPQEPTAIYFESNINYGTIFLDCGAASDVTKHIVLTYQEPVQDFNNPTDEPYYPQEYYLTLVWRLSKMLAPQYNRPWTPNHQSAYDEAVATGRHKDPENCSLYFIPEEE